MTMRSDARKRLAPDTITIPLPWIKAPVTANRVRGNVHARAAEIRNAHDVAAWAIKQAAPKPFAGCDQITLHYRPKTWHRRDSDGLYPTLKIAVDALVRTGVLPDDSFVCVSATSCRIHEPNGEPPAMWLTAEGITHYEPGVTP